MNNYTFDWKEIQEAAIKCIKEHPIGTLVALGIATGISTGIAKWGPHIENVGKYAVDKAAAYLPKPEQAILTDDHIINATVDSEQAEAVAA